MTISTSISVSVSTDLKSEDCPHEGHSCEGCVYQSVGGFCERPAARRLFITNAFSLSMLSSDSLWMDERLVIRRLADDEARQLLQASAQAGYHIVSGVGHADTAKILSGLLGTEVLMNRVSINLSSLDLLLVGQYSGPRLPEGATELPPGATIKWITVQIASRDTGYKEWEKRPDPERKGCFRPWRKKLADFIFGLVK